MKRELAIILATIALSANALPSPNPQVSDWIWKQGANLPGHVGVGDNKLRSYGYELDTFPTEQDAYFEYAGLIPVKSYVGNTAPYEVRNEDGSFSVERDKIYGTLIKYEPDRGKGSRQNYTVECILEKCYGDAMEEQMRRALSERALQFGGPLNEIAMIAKCNPVNLPVLRPGVTNRVPFKTWAARYKIWRVRGEMLYISGRQQFCETNAFDDLVSRFKVAYNITPGFHGFVEPICRSNDTNRVSYCLYPLGIVVHRAEDYTEEFAHFVNMGPTRDSEWEEWKAAYHGAKVDAWKMGIDLGVSGGWSAYIAALTADENWETAARSRIPANTLLMLMLYVDGGGNADMRAWCESDSIGRMIL